MSWQDWSFAGLIVGQLLQLGVAWFQSRRIEIAHDRMDVQSRRADDLNHRIGQLEQLADKRRLG